MIRKVLFLLVAISSITNIGNAQTFELNEKIPADPAVRIGKLENGLTYYIRHSEKPENQADFYIYHNVGAIQEEDHQAGLAHFLEHMAFNGTKNLPGKMLINYLETVGVKFGANLNAMTTQDFTAYNIKSLPTTREGIIDTALLILHDWSHFIALEDEEIDNERGVIIEERRMGLNAARRLQEANAPKIFNNTKYARRNVIGHEEGLKTFKYEDIREFYNRWYRPDLQAIVIVGDIDVDMVENKLKRIMADIPAPTNPEQKLMHYDPGNAQPVIGIATDPELRNTSVSYLVKHSPINPDDKDRVSAWKHDRAVNIVKKMATTRFNDIVQQINSPFLNYDIAPFTKPNAVSRVFLAGVVVRDGESAKGFEILYTEIERMRRHGFTKSELEIAKAQLLRESEKNYDRREDKRNNDYVWPLIDNYAENRAIPSAELAWELDQFTISSIDLEYINSFISKLVQHKNQLVLITGPQRDGITTPTEQEIRDIMAKVEASDIEPMEDTGGLQPLITKKIKSGKVKKETEGVFGTTIWTLSNGAKVVVKPTDFKNDEILVKISAPGGLALVEDEDMRSAVILKPVVERSGVGKFSQSELRKQLSVKTVELRLNTNYYNNGFQGNSSAKDVETLLQLINLYFTEPRISEEGFSVYTNGSKAYLRNEANNPSAIFRDSVERTIYGNNPRMYMTTIKNIDDAKYERLLPIYQKMYGNADDFTYIFVGDIDLKSFKPLVEKYIGSLPTTKSDRTFVDDGVRRATGKVDKRFAISMQVPKSTVTYYFSGDYDYNLRNDIMIEMARQILAIRYNAVIREEKGGTYGIRVRASANKNPIEYYSIDVMFETNKDMVDELAPIVVDEIKKIAISGPKQEDLSKIKEFMLKERLDHLKKNDNWRDKVNSYYLHGVDMTTGYEEIVSSISVEDIKNLFAKIIADNNITSLIMDPQ